MAGKIREMSFLLFNSFPFITNAIRRHYLTVCICTPLLASCSTPAKTIAVTCQERQVEIYIDGEYLGRDLVYYTVPKGQAYIEVSGRDNGMEVYNRRINVKDSRRNLIEIQVPKDYGYSSKPY